MRVLRSLPNMRKRLNNSVFSSLIKLYFNGKLSTDETSKSDLQEYVDFVSFNFSSAKPNYFFNYNLKMSLFSLCFFLYFKYTEAIQ